MIDDTTFTVAVAEVENLIQQVNAASQLMQESADEIQRLRAERDMYKALYEATQ